MEVTNAFYLTAKQKNYHFAAMAAKDLRSLPRTQIKGYLSQFQKNLSLDVIEYYPGVLESPVQIVAEGLPFRNVPSVSLELLEKGLADDSESSSIHPFEAGDLVRAMTPVKGTKGVQTMLPNRKTLMPAAISALAEKRANCKLLCRAS